MGVSTRVRPAGIPWAEFSGIALRDSTSSARLIQRGRKSSWKKTSGQVLSVLTDTVQTGVR